MAGTLAKSSADGPCPRSLRQGDLAVPMITVTDPLPKNVTWELTRRPGYEKDKG
jgi:hypothetical protein